MLPDKCGLWHLPEVCQQVETTALSQKLAAGAEGSLPKSWPSMDIYACAALYASTPFLKAVHKLPLIGACME